MLTLSLGDTVGVQQSILTDVLEEVEDGIEAWAALVTHFEYSTEDIKAEALFHKWEEESLLQGEHPDVLWARLSSIQRKLAKIGEGCSEKNVIRRFISAIEKHPGNPYNEVLAAYRGQLIKGKPFTSTELREFLSITHKKNNLNDNEKDRYQGATAMKGFITKEAKKCNHCRKPGHEKEQCWELHPDKRPKGFRCGNRTKKCYKCGKIGHLIRDCQSKVSEKVFTTVNENKNTYDIDCYLMTFIDSASSCHTVNSASLLDDETIIPIDKSVKGVDGTPIKLTHKGTRTIRLKQGTMRLKDVFYAKEL